MKTQTRLIFTMSITGKQFTNRLKAATILILFLFSIEGYSQYKYHDNRFYAYKGGSDIICGSAYNITKWNEYGSWIETWQNCRKRVWHQEFHSGFVYYQGPTGWYREWKEGNFWYFNWNDYIVRVS